MKAGAGRSARINSIVRSGSGEPPGMSRRLRQRPVIYLSGH